MKICITGSTGLIGSTATRYFLEKKHRVFGIDNNMRSSFFGKKATTSSTKKSLQKFPHYTHFDVDIREVKKINALFKKEKFDAVIHCAGQPSHDKAAEIPRLDFEINTEGTLTLLEAVRNFSPGATFIFTSTNKVYGDNPNRLPLKELAKRYRFADQHFQGIDETMSIDQNLHSLMGASKAAADLYYSMAYNANPQAPRLCHWCSPPLS